MKKELPVRKNGNGIQEARRKLGIAILPSLERNNPQHNCVITGAPCPIHMAGVPHIHDDL